MKVFKNSDRCELIFYLGTKGCGMISSQEANKWSELIYNCHLELKSVDPKYRILQIKEKLGRLRFYFSSTHAVESAEYRQMKMSVHYAEYLSGSSDNPPNGYMLENSITRYAEGENAL